ncbi:MAG: hypothetical protein EOP87_01370 [Verrucomicrobiaceae bacterium]|nr:MAG: hypothetical protein EOP87_01370 [Verrucomicrobiaceae bacterium]
MKRHTPVMHIALLGMLCAVAAFLGRQLHSASPSSAGIENALHHSRPDRPGRSASSLSSQAHDLAALQRLRERQEQIQPAESLQLARIPTPALREMIHSHGASLLSAASDSEAAPHGEFLRLAAVELYRRDGTEAYTWAAATPSRAVREILSHSIIIAAAADEPLLAKKWLDHCVPETTGSLTYEFEESLIKGALKRGGPKEAARLIGLLDLKDLRLPASHYPDGYDFKGLYSALAGKADLSSALGHWAMRDPDGAWAAVREDLHDKSLTEKVDAGKTFTTILQARLLHNDAAEGIPWGTARLAEFPPEDRPGILKDIASTTGRLSSYSLTAFAVALSPTDRNTLAGVLVKQHHNRERTYAVLETLPRADMLLHLANSYDVHRSRIDLAPAAAVNNPPTSRHVRSSAEASRFFADAEKRFSLTPEEITRMKAAPDR